MVRVTDLEHHASTATLGLALLALEIPPGRLPLYVAARRHQRASGTHL
jgi:hypothetical protein